VNFIMIFDILLFQRFPENRPGRDFMTGFLKRHPTLSVRKASMIKRSRAAVRREDVESFFENYKKVAEGVPPENVINYDETNLQENPGAKKGIFRRGSKYPEEVRDSSKTAISLMLAGTAAGKLLEPYVIYRAQYLYPSWCARGPKGAVYTSTPRGWIDIYSFTDWFKKVLLPYAKRCTGKVVIVGDNCSSHFSAEVFDLCKENRIEFVCLPANSTHMMQPLDVCFFSEMKKNWRAQLKEYGNQDPTAKLLEKKEFPRMLKELLDSLDPGKLLPIAFAKCGISPINSTKVTERIPSAVSSQEAATHLDQALIERLEVRRFGEGNRRRPRGKKLPAGQSYTHVEENSDDTDTEEAVENNSNSEEEDEDDEEDEEEEEEVEEDVDDVREAVSVRRQKQVTGTGKAVVQKRAVDVESQAVVGGQDEGVSDDDHDTLLDADDNGAGRPDEGIVVAVYQGTWYLAEVARNQTGVEENYTKLRYMQRVLNNCFMWGKEDVLDTVNTDILLKNLVIEPVNNRGHWKLRKNDTKKVESMMVVVFCFLLPLPPLSLSPLLSPPSYLDTIKVQYRYHRINLSNFKNTSDGKKCGDTGIHICQVPVPYQ